MENLTERENSIAVRIAITEKMSDEDYEDYIESMFEEYDSE